MMDSNMIAAIVNVIEQSNMSDLNLIEVVERPITIKIDEEGKESYSSNLFLADYMGAGKSLLSEAWVASNILLFTVFDGYLENKYNLTEGASFRNHYINLPQITALDIIEKDCYRIMKLIRNGIQHNLSSVQFNHGAYSVNYNYNNTQYTLQIDRWGIRFLYTIVLNLINGSIGGIYKKYCTDGHYIGILSTMYDNMRSSISQFSDDISGGFIGILNNVNRFDSSHLRVSVRYPVKNPILISEDESYVVFKHVEVNVTDDERDDRYQYSTDYEYKDYLLPQEMGIITKKSSDDLQERLTGGVIKFAKADITDAWKMKPDISSISNGRGLLG